MSFINEDKWEINSDAEGYWVWKGPYSSVQNAIKTVKNVGKGAAYDKEVPMFLSLPVPYPYFGFTPSIPYQELQIYKLNSYPNADYFAAMKITDPKNGSDYWFLSPLRDFYTFQKTVDLTPTAQHPNGNFWFEEEWDPDFTLTGVASGNVPGLYEMLQLSFAEPKLLGGWLGRIVTGEERESQGDWAKTGWLLKESRNFAFAEDTYTLYQYEENDILINSWQIRLNGDTIWSGKNGKSYYDKYIKNVEKSFEEDVANFIKPIVLYKKVSKDKLREFRLVGEGNLIGETPWYSLKIIEVNFKDVSASKTIKQSSISVNSFNTGANYWDFSFAMMAQDFQNDWKTSVDILCAEYDDLNAETPPNLDGVPTTPELGFFALTVRSLNGIIKTFFSMIKGVLIALPILMLLIGTYMGVIFTLKMSSEVVTNGG